MNYSSEQVWNLAWPYKYAKVQHLPRGLVCWNACAWLVDNNKSVSDLPKWILKIKIIIWQSSAKPWKGTMVFSHFILFIF
jgi:hypothetical protein